MIDLKQLECRRYKENQCISFQYALDLGKEVKPLVFRFSRVDQGERFWTLETQIHKTAFSDTQCYQIDFDVPRNDLPLTLICAIGLRYFKIHMQMETQYRANVDFTIGEVTEGM